MTGPLFRSFLDLEHLNSQTGLNQLNTRFFQYWGPYCTLSTGSSASWVDKSPINRNLLANDFSVKVYFLDRLDLTEKQGWWLQLW